MEIQMSEKDDLGLDDDDIQDIMDDNPDVLTPEDIFTMVLLNKRDKTKVSVELEDEDGDTIELADMMEELVNYIKDKLDDKEGNQIVDQVMPLMSQALVSGLGRLLGIQQTAYFISNPNTRMALIYMMMVSFVLYKTVQVKGLKVITTTEDVTDEEIEDIQRKSNASSVANFAAMSGMDPKEILQQMIKSGDLTDQDFEDIIGQKPQEDTSDEDKD